MSAAGRPFARTAGANYEATVHLHGDRNVILRLTDQQDGGGSFTWGFPTLADWRRFLTMLQAFDAQLPAGEAPDG